MTSTRTFRCSKVTPRIPERVYPVSHTQDMRPWGARQPSAKMEPFLSSLGFQKYTGRLTNLCYTLFNRRIRSEVLACSGYRLLANFHIAFAVNQYRRSNTQWKQAQSSGLMTPRFWISEPRKRRRRLRSSHRHPVERIPFTARGQRVQFNVTKGPKAGRLRTSRLSKA